MLAFRDFLFCCRVFYRMTMMKCRRLWSRAGSWKWQLIGTRLCAGDDYRQGGACGACWPILASNVAELGSPAVNTCRKRGRGRGGDELSV